MPQVTIMMSASTQLKQLMSVWVQVQAPRGHKQCPCLPSPYPHTADMSIQPPSLWRQNIAIISINIGYCCPKNAVTKQIWRWKNYSGVCFLYCDVQLNEISSGYLLYIGRYISGIIYIVWQFAFFSHIIFPLPISPPVTIPLSLTLAAWRTLPEVRPLIMCLARGELPRRPIEVGCDLTYARVSRWWGDHS